MFHDSFGLDSLDGPAFGAGALPSVIIGANGQVITRPAGISDADWAATVQQNQQQTGGQTALSVGTQVLNDVLTTIATIAAIELQRTGQVSSQTAAWQQQLAALQAGSGGGQYLTAEQIAALRGFQSQAQQQQAALTPWYKEPAVMVPLAIVGGVILAAGTAMMVRGRANRLPWADGWQADGWRAAAAWDY